MSREHVLRLMTRSPYREPAILEKEPIVKKPFWSRPRLACLAVIALLATPVAMGLIYDHVASAGLNHGLIGTCVLLAIGAAGYLFHLGIEAMP